ncbi:hypothetical protein BDV96DRAFT_690534 [Lophiotrema nucula]|uniref:Uncharacterized protein n=1 Tax=Lophiotrema nucula TaxID=690887 RepID=A0A6A5YYD1_9PLEO|nr:hypothetical protein BDV96DRAFT_690534 [Lophiotrema nucula]
MSEAPPTPKPQNPKRRTADYQTDITELAKIARPDETFSTPKLVYRPGSKNWIEAFIVKKGKEGKKDSYYAFSGPRRRADGEGKGRRRRRYEAWDALDRAVRRVNEKGGERGEVDDVIDGEEVEGSEGDCSEESGEEEENDGEEEGDSGIKVMDESAEVEAKGEKVRALSDGSEKGSRYVEYVRS